MKKGTAAIIVFILLIPFDILGYIFEQICISFKYGRSRSRDHSLRFADWLKNES